jgi:hypothetical protein
MLQANLLDLLVYIEGRGSRISDALGVSRPTGYVLAVATLVATIWGVLIAIACILLWPVVLAAFWQPIYTAAQMLWIRVVATVVCLLIGCLLYLARTFMPPVYGVAEIMVGAAACWAGLGKPSGGAALSGALALAAGLYVIVEGIVNVVKGLSDAD